MRARAEIVVALSTLAVACSQPDREPGTGERATVPSRTAERTREVPEPPPVDPCDIEPVGIAAAVTSLVEAHARCDFAVDCVEEAFRTSCISRCGVAIRPDGLAALRDRLAEIDRERCPDLARCASGTPQCARSSPSCVEGRCVLVDGDPILADAVVPAENARSANDAPPPRPPAGDGEQERGRRLLAAIAADDPALAQDFFFPREAFRHVKAISDPDEYWARLVARYAVDIHALHESTGDLEGATFDRLENVPRGGWVRIGEEANALPYHVSRHSWLHYEDASGHARKLEVRVLITWGTRWYVTHLNEHR